MTKIADVDKNFSINTNINKDNVVFYDCEQEPFRIYGVTKENGKFRRMSEAAAKSVSEGVHMLHTNTAGGRVRFTTDSDYIAIHAEMDGVGNMSHMALSGSAGFDLYASFDTPRECYLGTFVPPNNTTEGFDSVISLGERRNKLITINFPLYSNVNKLYIGLADDAALGKAPDYTIEKPIVYYGSSITQGGCASKPGSSYQSIISRRFDCNYINLGFSGNAKGEDEMTDYIKNLDMSIFVLDYDYNAPSTEHLKDTHARMFEKIRAVQPSLPIIIMPRPKHFLNSEEIKRRDVIENTYLQAKNKGDGNVYYIDNLELTELSEDNGTVDNCHPTDSGFLSMANALCRVIEKII